MFDLLSRYWWSLVVRGIFAILFGILTFLWPGLTVATLVVLFGAYVLLDGIFAVGCAITASGKSEDRWVLLLEGLLGIGVGILALCAPGIAAILLLVCIAAWSLLTGVLEIVAGIRLRKVIKGEWWMILSGMASIVLAFLLIAFPASGGITLVWLIAFFVIVFGAILLVLGLKLHGEKRKHHLQMN